MPWNVKDSKMRNCIKPAHNLTQQTLAHDQSTRLPPSHVKGFIEQYTPLKYSYGTAAVCCSEYSRYLHGCCPVTVSCESYHRLLCTSGETAFAVTATVVSCKTGLRSPSVDARAAALELSSTSRTQLNRTIWGSWCGYCFLTSHLCTLSETMSRVCTHKFVLFSFLSTPHMRCVVVGRCFKGSNGASLS